MTTYDDLSEKVVVITGGANGIGKAMVHAFVDQGARVHFCDLDSKSGKQLAKEFNGDASFRRVDLTREMEVRTWIDRIAKTESEIHVLINNAAVDPRIELTELTMKQWDSVFSLNIRAFVIAVQQAVPHMPRGGSIINFSSITHHRSPSAMSAYVATKSGII